MRTTTDKVDWRCGVVPKCFSQTLTLSECNRQTRVGDATFCQIIVEWAIRTFASYSCDGDKAFCKITLDRCKLQLRKSSNDAAFCRITVAMIMWPFVQLVWIDIDLSERNRQTRVGYATFCQIIVEWAMWTFAKLQLWWRWGLLIVKLQVENATAKVNLRCGLLLNYTVWSVVWLTLTLTLT